MDLLAQFGLEARHVPFHDDTGAFQAIAGKRAQIYATTAGALSKFDVKPLAILDPNRSTLLKDLPAISESGKDVFYSQWMVLVAPKNIPAPILKKIEDAMAHATKSPEFQRSLSRLALEPGYIDAEATRAFVAAESVRNGKTIKILMTQK